MTPNDSYEKQMKKLERIRKGAMYVSTICLAISLALLALLLLLFILGI